MNQLAVEMFDNRSEVFFDAYEAADPEDLHRYWLESVNLTGLKLLDVGSGSGRDANYFASKGFEVTAVEPSKKLMHLAQQKHRRVGIKWKDDKLPELSTIKASFDVIMCYAVWMFLSEEDRKQSMSRMAELLKPGGSLVLSIRVGSLSEGMVPYTQEGLKRMAKNNGLKLSWKRHHSDCYARKGVAWKVFVFNKPVELW